MKSDKFEEVFEKILEESAYDEVDSAIFMLVRLAYEAGWNAAEKQHEN